MEEERICNESASTSFNNDQLWCILTLCDPMDCSLPDSSDCGILQARKNSGVDSYSLLQGIFLIQGSNLVSCIAGIIPYHLSCYYSYSMPLSSDTTVYVSFKICLFFEGTNKMYLPERLYTWQSSYLLVMYATRVYALSFTLHRKHTHKSHRTVNQSFL